MEPLSSTFVSAHGEVVEIFEREGELCVKVVLSSPTVLDLVIQGLHDLHLGDQVVIDGSFTVCRVRKAFCQAPPAP